MMIEKWTPRTPHGHRLDTEKKPSLPVWDTADTAKSQSHCYMREAGGRQRAAVALWRLRCSLRGVRGVRSRNYTGRGPFLCGVRAVSIFAFAVSTATNLLETVF